ncbi:MAG: SpoIID/LytB domain-containing protein [Lachnospiraceae bacterium]|jgi:stage II sporulation protein D
MFECCKKILAGMLIFLALPGILTLFLSGRQACPLAAGIDIEDYVAIAAAMEIPWNAQAEAIKAQCIIARTNLYREMREGGSDTLRETAAFLKESEKRESFREHFSIFEDAAAQTYGEILTWQGQVQEIPFFRISGGKTRDGKEILGEGYGYLPSVETAEDLNSEEFLEGFYFTKEDLEAVLSSLYADFAWCKDEAGEEKSMEEQIVITAVDAADYVMEIQIGNRAFLGEELRNSLNLNSSCFTVQILGEQIRFLCKGLGHGIGLSQYTADVMAKEGENYKNILLRFFPSMEIMTIEYYEKIINP